MKLSSSRNARRVLTAGLVVATGLTYDVGTVPANTGSDLVCPETSPQNAFNGAALDEATSPSFTAGVGGKDGVVFDASTGVGKLRLQRRGGSFRSANVAISGNAVYGSPGDFNNDGWMDFAGSREFNSTVDIYINRSYENLPVDWDDPDDILDPKFNRDVTLSIPYGNRFNAAAGDFNGDGWDDVMWAGSGSNNYVNNVSLFLNKGALDSSGNPTFHSRVSALSNPADMGILRWSTQAVVGDFNGDRKLDVMVGSSNDSNGNHWVRIFYNQCNLVNPLPPDVPDAPEPLPCANTPTFTLGKEFGGFKLGGKSTVASYEDFTGDGIRDLVVSSPNASSTASKRLRLFPGITGGDISYDAADVQSLDFIGASTATMAADFSLDGKMDLIAATDNWSYNNSSVSGGMGGYAFYYQNDGTDTPFSGGVDQTLTRNNQEVVSGSGSKIYDYDVGFTFDYDNDPDSTPDVFIADGNHSANFYILANRVVSEYVDCGDAASGTLDLATMGLDDTEMVVTAARLKPTYTLNGGSITFYLSNQIPQNWVEATDCGDGSGDVCAQFDRPIGREVQWKATMCANQFNTTTPELTGMQVKFDYSKASIQYRAGVVVSDGVAYTGGFRQPGERGHMFATDAALDGVYWDAAEKLDAMADSARNVYTTTTNGKTLIAFKTSEADNADLQETLLTADADQTRALIDWVRSKRFGVGNVGIDKSRHGAVETSTAAVLAPPGKPFFYNYLKGSELTASDQFQTAHANRPVLVLYGSKDGMIHAVYNNPEDINGDARNGEEAWAVVPPGTASGMLTDYTTTVANGELQVSSYPDGSPTLADVMFSDGSFRSVMIVSSGNGGRTVFAMDVTDTVDEDGNVSSPPKPLWSIQPGNNGAGLGHSKPAIIRVKIGNQTRFLAIMATGIDPVSGGKGRRVWAVDVETGSRVWQFNARCPVTSNVVAFETDDTLEFNGPTLDGYIDRVVFADNCGYVYKLDPGVDVGNGWNNSANYGSIPVHAKGNGDAWTDGDGNQVYALFSTKDTTDALNARRPIVGTLGARIDSTDRVVLYFGTGGLESYDPTRQNGFFAVYADTGAVRSKELGTCTDGRCEKFYGGVVVTTEQVVTTRTTDPEVGTGACDVGSTVLTAFDVNGDPETTDFLSSFSIAIGSAVVSSLFGHAGAIYTSSVSGNAIRVGTPRAATAGEDSANGISGANGGTGESDEGGGGGGGQSSRFTVVGYRQVL